MEKSRLWCDHWKISDKEVEEELGRLQNSLAQLAPAEDDAALKNGLVATIDFNGTLDGKEFKGGSAKDYVFEFGTGQLLKEFEDNIQGMRKNDSKDIEITFPKDYFEKSLASKQAKYHITLKNLHIKNLPALDDELAKDIGKDNLEQVKTELKDSLLKRKERGFHRDYVEEVKEQLLKSYKFDVPQSIIKAEIERSKRKEDEVVNQLKLELILEEIAVKEQIRATPQDMEQRFAMLAQMYRQPAKEIQQLYAKNNMMGILASQIVLDKTLDFIVNNANMV